VSIDVTVTHLSGSRKDDVETFRELPLMIGRADTCQLRFDADQDRRVSALHAELRETDDGKIELHDLNSRNGVLVNGARVQGALAVPNHATIEVGEGGPRVRVTFEAGGGISFNRVRRKSDPTQKRDEVLRRLASTDSHKVYKLDEPEVDTSARAQIAKQIAAVGSNGPLAYALFIGALLLALAVIALIIFS